MWDVEKIVDFRCRNTRTCNSNNDQDEYLIKWLGYDDSENTWEPAHHLNNVNIADPRNWDNSNNRYIVWRKH